MKKEKEVIIVVGQLVGLKNLRIEGGWRLSIDLFESRERDAMMVLGLVNRRETVKITIEPVKNDK